MSVIIFLIILAILILSHEFGHFIVAKKSGIRVDEFGLGFPPRIFGFKYGETEYSLNWIPFGGFVRIFGENPDEDSIEGPDKARSMIHKSRYIQALVLVAGVTCNFIFGWLLLSFGFMAGLPVSTSDTTAHLINPTVTITDIAHDSPAAKAGLEAGDRIVSLMAGADTATEVTDTSVRSFLVAHGGKPVTVNYTYGNNPSLKHVEVTPEVGVIPGSTVPAIGISMDTVGILKLPPWTAFYEGARYTVAMVGAIIVAIWQLITSAFHGGASLSAVTGPVGLVGVVGSATRMGFTYLLTFTALISFNLAVINLIPFPALDGGRLLFLLIEAIKGSRLNPKVANTLNTIGFALLILLMLAVTYTDIVHLIK